MVNEMNENINKQVKTFKQLEESGFTSEQIEAIVKYIDYRIDLNREIRNLDLSDIKIEIRKDIKHHEHLNGKVVIPFKIKEG